MTSILVYGAGAIGGWVAARFSITGPSVTVLCRPAAAEAIAQRGLEVTRADAWPLGARNIRAVTELGELAGEPPFDWIFLTVKAFDLDKALEALQGSAALGPATRLMGFQNGIGTDESLVQAVGAERAYSCVVTRPIALGPKPGVLHESAQRGGLAVAPLQAGNRFEGIERALEGFGAPVTRADDYRSMKWSKLLLNMTANALCAILDASPAEVYGNSELFALERQAFFEALACMRAQGVEAMDFPDYPARLLARAYQWLPPWLGRRLMLVKVAGARGSKQPSLRLEMEHPRPQSEVRFLNGGIVTAGQALGIPTPANQFITRTLCDILERRTAWDTWRKQPQALLDAYARACKQG